MAFLWDLLTGLLAVAIIAAALFALVIGFIALINWLISKIP